MKRLIFGFGLCLVCLSALAEPAPSLRIASDATFPPFHFLGESGVATGFDIELARAVATRAGFDPEIMVLPYDRLFAGLTDGSHDVVAATTGITAKRQREFLFSTPYFETCQAAVVRMGASEPWHVIDLRERRIGASGQGTSAQAMYETLAAAHVRIAEGAGPAMLDAEEIDAWIVDEFEAVATARASHGRFGVLPEPVMPERYGFVMAPGNTELKAKLDEALASLDDEGVVAELERRFGVRRDAEWPIRY